MSAHLRGEGYAEALLKTLKTLGDNFENQDDAWRANLMWAANQALNGLIGSGVSQDWLSIHTPKEYVWLPAQHAVLPSPASSQLTAY